MRFTTGANAVTGYLKAEIYSGYGTVWLDDVQLSDVFGGEVPVAFGGSVTSDAGGLTQTASVNGLTLNARYTNAGTAIRVDATLTDTTGQDRPVEVSYRLPLDVAGWKWQKNIYSATAIQDGVRYENVDFTINSQGRSTYPFATVTGSATSISLAVPMGPQMQRFGYDTVNGLRSTWDLGLSAAATKTQVEGELDVLDLRESAGVGISGGGAEVLRVESLELHVAAEAAGGVGASKGARSCRPFPHFKDFGWGVQEGDGIDDIDFANENGIPVYHYIFPNGWFYDFPGRHAALLQHADLDAQQRGRQRDGDDGAERADRRDGAGDHQLLPLQRERALHGSGQLLLLVQQHLSDLSGAARIPTFRRRACGAS